MKNAEENFTWVFLCPRFSSKIEVVQMGIYEQSWFPFRLFNLLAIFDVWATREAPRILEWIAIPFSRGSSGLRDQTWVSCITGRLFSLSHQGSPYYPYFVEKLNLRIILLSFFFILPFNTEIVLITITKLLIGKNSQLVSIFWLPYQRQALC